ncbi:hypothetical protein PVK06_033294 [Gossypium arboreum]|uniref:Uncharacterized protein n=1 Tax=Gossypium arboreum TaxID=29729 RepID=A0ABR0NB01_GOSAR|nr:hypothetical protein PVK06_033294 [Gossypium arboreum]
MGITYAPKMREYMTICRVSDNYNLLHPLIDEFVQTLEGENGICCTHPQRLPDSAFTATGWSSQGI